MFTFRSYFRPFLVLVPVFILTAAPLASADDLPTLEQILDRYIEALGGRDKIAKLETRAITGKQIDDRPYVGEPVTTELEAWADNAGVFNMVLHEAEGDQHTGSDEDHHFP